MIGKCNCERKMTTFSTFCAFTCVSAHVTAWVPGRGVQTALFLVPVPVSHKISKEYLWSDVGHQSFYAVRLLKRSYSQISFLFYRIANEHHKQDTFDNRHRNRLFRLWFRSCTPLDKIRVIDHAGEGTALTASRVTTPYYP